MRDQQTRHEQETEQEMRRICFARGNKTYTATNSGICEIKILKGTGPITSALKWGTLVHAGNRGGKVVNTLRTGLLNCLNARSRGLTFRHRASCI